MPEPRNCPICGAELLSDSPGAECVQCLLGLGLGRAEGDVAVPMEQPAQDSAESTVVAAITEEEGDLIGRYELLQKIGEGGCGVVYMAEQKEPVRRRVALKVIKLGMDTKQVIGRFEAERQALALMDHPNIAKVLDAGATDTGRPYFVMELLRGVRITEYCDDNGLSIRERLALFTQVCLAIQHAHQKGIIHRDIKPSNILVTMNDGLPVPKVIDFGIAKATTGQSLTNKTLFTAFEQFVGTPAYMSPEQAEMSALDIDTRSDIYSLGVLLYELLTGKTPFDTRKLIEGGLDEMRRIIREEQPPRPSTRLSTLREADLASAATHRSSDSPKLLNLIRGDLDWIAMKTLEKDRTRRYETANGLAMDIQRHLHDEPVLARPPSTMYRLKRFARRHRTPVTIAAGFMVLLTVATAVSMALALWANQERRRAAKSENEARTVLNFFQDKVLAAARPQGQKGGLGRDVTLRAAVESVEPSIATAFTNQPLVEASIQDVIGTTYNYLGEYTNAIPHYERALVLRRHYLGSQNPDTLKSMNNLANAYQDAGQRKEALSLYEETLKVRKPKLGADHPDTLVSMDNLANAYQVLGRFSEALPLYEDTLKLAKARLGPDHPDTLTAMNNLATAYDYAGRRREAFLLHEETLKLRKAKLGLDHPATLTSMNNLAKAYQDADRPNEALPLHEETLKLRKAKLGPDHPVTLTSMNDLARAYQAANRLSEALSLFEETLKLQKAKLGPDHPDTLRSLSNLAEAYQAAGRRKEALASYEERFRLRKAKLGADDPDTLRSMSDLAHACQAAGRRDEALSLFQEILKLANAKFGPDHPHTLKHMSSLAVGYQNAERLSEALPLYEQTFKLQKAKLGLDHSDTRTTMQNLALAYRDAARFADAEALYEDLLTYRRKNSSADSTSLADILASYGQCLLQQGKHANAEPLLRESLNIREKKMPDDWETFKIRSRLGMTLLGQKKYVEAEPLLVQGYQGLKERQSKLPKGSRTPLKDASEPLVRLYEDWGKPEKAAEWRQKLEASTSADKQP